MFAEWVVESFDVVEDHGVGLGAGGWELVMEAFGFEGGPEGLGGGVVITVTATAHALVKTELMECGGEGMTGILAALIAVVDEGGRGLMRSGDGVVEGIQNEARFHVIGGGPADHLAAKEIYFRGHKERAFLCVNVGYVSDPDLARFCGWRGVEETVGSWGAAMGTVRGARRKAPLLVCSQSLRPHESGNAAASATVAAIPQILAQARGAVSLAAVCKGVGDFLGEKLILLVAWTLVFLKVVVETATADAQGQAEILERELSLGKQVFDQSVKGGGS